MSDRLSEGRGDQKPQASASPRHFKTKTYFPPGTGILLVCRDDDEIELQLGEVDESGRFTAISQPASQTQQPGFASGDRGDRKPVRRAQFQSFTLLNLAEKDLQREALLN